MTEELVPIFRVEDGRAAAAWYERLGFEVVGEHRFTPDLPLYLFLRRGEVHLHLSEHTGDAPTGSVAYFYVDDVDRVAEEFGVPVRRQPWGREVELTDPDGNRIRVGTALGSAS
jgi:catechol 2,3-dioxygenase-like lactoylglutathione lyase family enzyme